MSSINMASILAKASNAVRLNSSSKKKEAMKGIIENVKEEDSDKIISTLVNCYNDAVDSCDLLGDRGKEAVRCESSVSSTTSAFTDDTGHAYYWIFVDVLPLNRSRMSVAPDYYGGVDDISVILNNGMSTKSGKSIFGMWHDEHIKTLPSREGAHFVQQAMRSFEGNFASEYHVEKISCDEKYNN